MDSGVRLDSPSEPWRDRRGVVCCAFDRAGFRVEMLVMAGVLAALFVFLIARGQRAAAAVTLVTLGMTLAVVYWSVYRQAADRVLEVDFDRAEFRLRWFRYPLGFWDIRKKPSVVVPFGAVHGVWVGSTKRGRTACIATDRSRFWINEDTAHFDRVVELVHELSPQGGTRRLERRMGVMMWWPALVGVWLACAAARLLGWI